MSTIKKQTLQENENINFIINLSIAIKCEYIDCLENNIISSLISTALQSIEQFYSEILPPKPEIVRSERSCR